MVLNYIWIGFFVIAFIIALIKVIVLDIYGYHELYIRLLQNGIRDIARTYGCTGPLVGHHENRREQRID